MRYLLACVRWLFFSTYTKIGPFTNGASPPVNKAFLDPLENFLAGFKYGFASFTTGGTLITHNLGVTPSGIFVTVAGVAGVTYFINGYASTTTMTVVVSTNCNGWWLVIA